MELSKINEIINKINRLTNNDPFSYLETKSNWFNDDFVDMKKINKFPHLEYGFEDFFFNPKIKKFNKEVALKFLINESINNCTKDLNLTATWIIKIWGGIKGIKDSSIREIIDNLDKKNYSFNNISSWSKVHSFKNIKRDVIYDSKVIYSLNWLILTLNSNNRFFLQPESRNKKLITFPITSIINFKNSSSIDISKKGHKAIESIYYKENEVYQKFIELITVLNKKLWNDKYINLSDFTNEKIYLKDYNFFTELLLFNMADDVILDDIRKNINIEIK